MGSMRLYNKENLKRTYVMKKKMKFYLPILFILWTGAFVQKIERNKDLFIHTNQTVELQNGIKKQGKQINTKNSVIKKESIVLFEREYKGKRSQAELKEEISFLLASYKGEFVREIFGDNFYCVYGFSDSVNDYIISENEKINLNFVITYDERKDITYMIGASPFYNEDF